MPLEIVILMALSKNLIKISHFALCLWVFFGTTSGQLSANFYARTCPNFRSVITRAVNSTVSSEARMGASLLRLHFHDCFVNVSIYNLLPPLLSLQYYLLCHSYSEVKNIGIYIDEIIGEIIYLSYDFMLKKFSIFRLVFLRNLVFCMHEMGRQQPTFSSTIVDFMLIPSLKLHRTT